MARHDAGWDFLRRNGTDSGGRLFGNIIFTGRGFARLDFSSCYSFLFPSPSSLYWRSPLSIFLLPRKKNKIGKVNGLKCPASWVIFLIGFCICFLVSLGATRLDPWRLVFFFGRSCFALCFWILVDMHMSFRRRIGLGFPRTCLVSVDYVSSVSSSLAHIASIIHHISSLFCLCLVSPSDRIIIGVPLRLI